MCIDRDSSRPLIRRGLLIPACLVLAYLLVNGVFVWRLQQAAEETRYHKLIFADRELREPILIPTDEMEATLELVEPEWRGVPAYALGYMPIARWAMVYRIANAPDGKDCYYAPTLLYEAERLSAKSDDSLFRTVMFSMSVITLWLGIALLQSSRDHFWTGAAGVLLLRLTSLLWTHAFFGGFTIHSGDEDAYLHIALKLADWSHELLDSRYTIGNPLLYLPLLLLKSLNWTNYGFIGVTTVLHFFVYGLGALVLWMWLVKRVAQSHVAALWTGLALVLYPWSMRVFHVPAMEDGLFSFFGLWLVEPVETTFIDFYYYTNFVGYNALSDTPAMFFALLSLLMVNRNVARGRSCFWAGLVFGLSVLIRISNVFLAVPIAVVMLGTSYRRLINIGLSFAAGSAIAFAPQLVWNFALFGDALFFGYRLLEEDYKGFQLAKLASGASIMGSTFQQLMGFAALSLIIIRRRFSRLPLVLAAAILPLIVFYGGYHALIQCPVRFVLTPVCGMLAASALLVSLREERRAALACVALAAVVVPGQPFAAFVLPVPEWISIAGAAILSAVLWRWKARWPYFAFVGLLAIGWPALTYATLCVACAWILASEISRQKAVIDLRQNLATTLAAPPGNDS